MLHPMTSSTVRVLLIGTLLFTLSGTLVPASAQAPATDDPQPGVSDAELEKPQQPIPPADVDWSRVAGSGGTLARIQVSPSQKVKAVTPSSLTELVGLAGAVTPSDLGVVEPADLDFHRAAEPPRELSWDARMNLLEEAGVPFEPLPAPSGEFTLSARNNFSWLVGHLRFVNPFLIDPLSDKAVMPPGGSYVIVHVLARESGRYLLVFRVSAREEATYTLSVDGDRPSYTRDPGSHSVSFVLEADGPGEVRSAFYTPHDDVVFTFHDVTVTRVD